mmetsp:Transcript_38339/g.67277  ORF Transcript_38339/g.67277 Transcript_38339/m.67277 type:complete len:267 (+) Transcript_38339:517-1317(+)
MPLRDRTNTPNYATVPVPSNYAWQEKENSQQYYRDEKAAIAKALFDKEVERRVQEEKERHRLIDSEVQRQMIDIMPPLKRSAHVSVPSSGDNSVRAPFEARQRATNERLNRSLPINEADQFIELSGGLPMSNDVKYSALTPDASILSSSVIPSVPSNTDVPICAPTATSSGEVPTSFPKTLSHASFSFTRHRELKNGHRYRCSVHRSQEDAMLTSKYSKAEPLPHLVLMPWAAFVRMDFLSLLTWVGAVKSTLRLAWMCLMLCSSG